MYRQGPDVQSSQSKLHGQVQGGGGGRDRGLRGQGGGEEVIEGPRDCDRGLGLRK